MRRSRSSGHADPESSPIASSASYVAAGGSALGLVPDDDATEFRDILTDAVSEAARLVGAAGGIIYLVDPTTGDLRFGFDAGITDDHQREWARSLRLPVGVGVFGKAVAERTVQLTDDYMRDAAFAHSPLADRVVREVGIRSMVAAPLISGETVLGALGTFSDRAGAFGEQEAALVRALADHAAVAIVNRRLIDRLARSEAALERSARVERALREIGTGLAELREPGAVVRQTLEAAVRLLGADAGRIDATPADELGLRRQFGDIVAGALPPIQDPTGVDASSTGITGGAIRAGRPIVTADYLTDPSFTHTDIQDAYVREHGIRSVATVPLSRAGRTLGALTVLSRRSGAFTEADGAVLAELATQTVIAILNASLIDQLARSREELGRTADRERTLRGIDAELTAIHEPDRLLQRVVEESVRLLDGSRAQLDLVDPVTGLLARTHIAGWDDPDDAAWRRPHMRRDEGMTGLAVAAGGVAWTDDFLADQRFVHTPQSDAYVRGAGIRSVIAAPLLADNVLLGALKVSSERPAAFGPGDGELLLHLACQAALALANRRLLDRLTDSEARHRYLVSNSPDLVWAIDENACFTFLSDTCARLTGWEASELLGRHFGALIHPSSGDTATRDWTTTQHDGSQELRGRFNLLHRDGHAIPAEFIAHSTMEAGRFAGANGSVRDMSERERLEASLQRQAAELAAGEERAHLARELHDSVTQALFSMTLVTRTVELLMDRDPAAARDKLRMLGELQRDALAEMRSLIFELRPGSLEDQGLVQALRRHATAVEGRIGIPITFEARAVERAPIEIEEALYRIAQEALHNVVKHARARRIRLSLSRVRDGLQLEVADDGVGFDPAVTGDGRLGLAGMRARAERVGGRLTIRSRRGGGTTVKVVVPDRSADRPA